MPFDAEFQSVFDKLIVPALENCGYEVKRADSDLDQQNVLKDVVRGIADADLVIAELTSRNPNVLYELGLSHALRRNTVLITQAIEEIPFDLRAYRVIRYSTQFDSAEELLNELQAIGEANLRGEIEFGSPIVDFLPDHEANVKALPARHLKPVDASSDSAATTDEEMPPEGFLDAIITISGAGTQLMARMDRIGEWTVAIGEQFQKTTAAAEEIQEEEGSGMVLKMHRLAGETAKALDGYAEQLATEAPLLEEDAQRLISGGLAYTSWLANQADVDPEQARENRQTFDDLGSAIREGLEGAKAFRKTLTELGGISRDMARGTGRAIQSLDSIAEALEQVEAFTRKAVDLLDERLDSEDGLDE
jgi:hypothetical protein